MNENTKQALLPDRGQQQTVKKVATILYDGPEAISQRLAELDREWTVGRYVKVGAGIGILLGVALTVLVDSSWLLLLVLIGGLLLQYAFGRPSLLTRLLRPLGWRTGLEVEHERVALKTLRGDFRNLPTVFDKVDQDAVARLEGEGGIPGGPVGTKVDNRTAAEQVLSGLQN
jgi:hypothetical protein